MAKVVKTLSKAATGPGLSGCLVVLMLCFPAIPDSPALAETLRLDRLEHIHGLTVDREQPERLYLATHSGLFLASPNGTASRVGDAQDDFMSFVADPKNPEIFYASGHPPGGGNLGVLVSRDRGESWERLAAGAGGPVDFHAMDVSRADRQVIYGMFQGLQVSRDGGRTWRVVGKLPKDTFDLAASARHPDRIYAAARGGLFVSENSGGSWAPATLQRRPATMVHVAADGRVYAFVYGVGLLAGDDKEQNWELRSARFADRYLIHMASDPANPQVLHVVSNTGAVVTSRDGGRSWVSYVGHDRESPELIAEAGRLYGRLCQSCHGAKGVGERPEDPGARDEYGFVAPALDDSAHGWHHGDDGLVGTILNGSPRNPRMIPFKELVTEDDARNLVAYIKSLWSFRSLACQGARHMRCMH
jgi:mono/diheme cytochrome c family protein